MKVTAHPRYRELASLVQSTPALATTWNGVVFRSVSPQRDDPGEILSGQGSFHRGARWNAPGTVRAVYASTKPEVATAESLAQFRYYGFRDEDAMPRLMVAITVKLTKVLDLTNAAVRRKLKVTLSEIRSEDWRKIQDRAHESLTQALGRAAAAAGLEGLIVSSAQLPRGVNVVYFPGNRTAGGAVDVLQKEP